MLVRFFPVNVLCSLLMALSFSCSEKKPSDSKLPAPPPVEAAPAPCQPDLSDTTISVGRHFCDLRAPAQNFKGSILVLPGWNFPRTDWCEKSALCDRALKRGYALILPEMGKSIYQSSNYPETRPDWLKFPTGTWLWDTLIPHLQENHCLFTDHQANFALGLSTGARGAVMATYKMPGILRAAAALSGDYEQRALPKDNLMRGFYGELKSFPDRWAGEDNPAANAEKILIPLFLGHGVKDPVVPVDQTLILFDSLKAHHHHGKTQLHLDSLAVHDYNYWNAEVGPVLDFFDAQF